MGMDSRVADWFAAQVSIDGVPPDVDAEGPLAWSAPVQVRVESGCFAVLDENAAGGVWEDLAYDGPQHSHVSGGVAFLPGGVSVGIEFEWDFMVRFACDPSSPDVVWGLWFDASPWADDVAEDVLADVYGPDHDHDGEDQDSHGHGDTHEHGHGHGSRDGWQEQFAVPGFGPVAFAGDPAGGDWAYNEPTPERVVWPGERGVVNGRVRMERGLRRDAVLWWSSAT